MTKKQVQSVSLVGFLLGAMLLSTSARAMGDSYPATYESILPLQSILNSSDLNDISFDLEKVKQGAERIQPAIDQNQAANVESVQQFVSSIQQSEPDNAGFEALMSKVQSDSVANVSQEVSALQTEISDLVKELTNLKNCKSSLADALDKLGQNNPEARNALLSSQGRDCQDDSRAAYELTLPPKRNPKVVI